MEANYPYAIKNQRSSDHFLISGVKSSLPECGSSSSRNNTYAVRDSSSPATPGSCSYTFCRADSEVCKIRIDFDILVLAPPSGPVFPPALAIDLIHPIRPMLSQVNPKRVRSCTRWEGRKAS